MQPDSKLKVAEHQRDSESEEEEEEEEEKGVALELFAGHTPLSWRSDGGKKERRRRKKRKLDKVTRVVLERQEVGCFFVSENCQVCHVVICVIYVCPVLLGQCLSQCSQNLCQWV